MKEICPNQPRYPLQVSKWANAKLHLYGVNTHTTSFNEFLTKHRHVLLWG